MTNKEKYEGKTVRIYSPISGRFMGRIVVEEVLENTKLCGIICGTDVYGVHDLNGGCIIVLDENDQ